jgi:porphobilinogen synthase
MPGVYQLSLDAMEASVDGLVEAGIQSIILFGLPAVKDDVGSENVDPEGIIPQALARLRRRHPALCLITDLCCCEYTDHGHCGILKGDEVDNDATLEYLGRVALSQARAGADLIAPSGMMDGFVGFLRESLDEEGFEKVGLLAYSAKFASGYYGPFRTAVDSTPAFGDRAGYQMDPANVREAMRELALDVEEGADIVMVKPALAYLDVIAEARGEFDVPIAAYNVSGEYAMLKAAAEKGWIDYDRVMMETLTSIRRAGADLILTYHAKEAARLLRGAR